MPIETEEKTIDGRQVMVTQFPGRRALTFKTRLLKLLGPSIAQMFSGVKTDKSNILDSDFDLSIISKACEKLSETLDEDEFVKFVLELLQCTRLDGKEINDAVFDIEFAGNLVLMYKVLWFTLEVNYGSFFGVGGIGKILSKIKEKKEEIKMPQKSNKSSSQSPPN